jgi:hypothetical protein
MTKNYFFIILLLISLTSCGQETFEFESKINPEKIYTLSMNMSSTNKTKYLTERTDLKDKTSEGISSTEMTRITTTKKIEENGQFAATIEYGKIIKIANGSKTENPITGTIVNGYYKENTLNVQEVISEQLNEKTKNSIKYALENVKPDIDFPKKPLKIGDSFEHKMPMTIPVDGTNPVKINIIKTFKLKSVKDNIALFDLEEIIQLNTEIEQTNVIANGNGNGFVEFDISENHLIKNNASFTIELNVKINDELTVNTVVGSNSEITTIIE